MKLLITFWLGYALAWNPSAVSVNASLVDLFQISRSKDTKTIHYQLKLNADDSIDTTTPLKIFWVIETQGEIDTEKLTWIQNKYAYGIHVLNVTPESLSFHFVSYEQRIINVHKNLQGEYQAYTTGGSSELILEKIFVQIDGGTFWLPKISSVKLEGKDLQTCKSTIEIIKP